MQSIEWTWIFNPEVDEKEDIDRNVISFKTDYDKIQDGHIAIVIHGAACTPKFMRKLVDNIGEVKNNNRHVYDAVYTLAYDWRKSINDNALSLAGFVEDLHNRYSKIKIDLHGYSLGGVLARWTNQRFSGMRPFPVRHVFTYHSPMAGTPLAHLSAIGRIGGWCLSGMKSWKSPGVEDLIPGSWLIELLSSSQQKNETYIAGRGGHRFLGGITRYLFGDQDHDGISSVHSQTCGAGKHFLTEMDHFGVLFGEGYDEIEAAVIGTLL